MPSETIAAVATPPGMGGVGIVRVSGPLVSDIAIAVLGCLPRPREATFSSFQASDGVPLDQGIALRFAAPQSFTGEDVLELQGHGGPVVMDLLLKRCVELGARPARPGEFSERAFLNGKIDLAQAEAVADLIESSTAVGARLAAKSLQGVFSARIGELIEGLIRARTWLEASLDFPEEEIGTLAESSLGSELDALIRSALEIVGLAQQGERIRNGLTVVIAGRTNAGKSSLLNALAQTDAAIVAAIPGTTRDVLKVDIEIAGLPVRIVDTAGLRDTEEPVEREGVRRARDQIGQADLVLWVYDAVAGLDLRESAELQPGVQLALVRNKVDLAGPRSPDEGVPPYAEIPISALTGLGLPELRDYLRAFAGVAAAGEGAFMARRRHLEALGRGLAALRTARAALVERGAAELVALDLLEAQRSFGEITGVFSSDELLGRIFSSFCIGK